MVDESEERESGKTLVINGSSSNKDLTAMIEARAARNFTFRVKNRPI